LNREQEKIMSSHGQTAAKDPYKGGNIDEPSLKAKIEGLVGFVKEHKTVMMTTRQPDSGMLVSRCMAVADIANEIDLQFFTNKESGKTDELDGDQHINISILTPTGEWASISGLATIISDRNVIHEKYSRSLKAWMGDLGDKTHDGGPDDPRIGIIQVETLSATYSLTKGNPLTRGFEVAKGTALGSVPDINKLREITKEDIATFRHSQTLIGQSS